MRPFIAGRQAAAEVRLARAVDGARRLARWALCRRPAGAGSEERAKEPADRVSTIAPQGDKKKRGRRRAGQRTNMEEARGYAQAGLRNDE